MWCYWAEGWIGDVYIRHYDKFLLVRGNQSDKVLFDSNLYCTALSLWRPVDADTFGSVVFPCSLLLLSSVSEEKVLLHNLYEEKHWKYSRSPGCIL